MRGYAGKPMSESEWDMAGDEEARIPYILMYRGL